MMEYLEKHAPTFKQVAWHEIEAEVKKVNPEFHTIVCELDPGPEYRLYVGEYPYGYQLLKNGRIQIPVSPYKSAPLTSDKISKQIRDDLSYNKLSNPVSLILQNSFEIYINNNSPNLPAMGSVVPTGTLFSLSRVVCENEVSHHPAFVWDMTSGARSIYMLPKISQTKKYKRLRAQLGINVEPPKSNLEHWHVFKEIAIAEQAPTWKTKSLMFSKKWFASLEDSAWLKFKSYLLNQFRRTYDLLGNNYIWDMLFCLILQEKKLRPSLYINNIVTHLFQIYLGTCPASAPAIDENFGPIEFLQQSFLNIYGLTDYLPTILIPQRFSHTDQQPVYYSLQNSNIIGTPKKKDNSSLISDLYDINALLNKYLIEIKSGRYNLEDTPFYDNIDQLEITPFHPTPERYQSIKTVEEIPKNDPSFTKILCKNQNPNLEVALHSSLLNGCFRFSFKK
jgi:hypothetical protein